MPAWLVPALTMAGSAIANKLKGKSPQQKFLEWIKGQANRPESELGYTGAEKNALRFGAKNRLRRGAAETNSSMAASAARRGGVFTPQAKMDVTGKYAQAFGDFIPQVDIESARLGRERKDKYTSMLGDASMNMPDESITPDLAGLSENLTLLSLLKKNGVEPGATPSTGFMSGLPNAQPQAKKNAFLQYLMQSLGR